MFGSFARPIRGGKRLTGDLSDTCAAQADRAHLPTRVRHHDRNCNCDRRVLDSGTPGSKKLG
jgi:hypothetical protein